MSLFRDIRGQDNALRYLLKSLSTGRISESYLFSGPRGVGKSLVSNAFVKNIICGEKGLDNEACDMCASCRRINSYEHPDIYWIRPEKNKTIKIDEIRKVKDVLSLKPYEAPVNACIIDDAHMMTQEASNALLKVLEEPPSDSLIILLTDKTELMLETVLSRCSKLRFNYLSLEETRNIILEKTGISEEDARFLAYFSQGSPGIALEMIEEDVEARKEEILNIMETIIREENFSCMNWDIDDKNRLMEDVETLIMIFRDILIGKEGMKDMLFNKDLPDTGMYDFFSSYSAEKIYGIMENLIDAKRALKGSVNPKIIAQALPGKLRWR